MSEERLDHQAGVRMSEAMWNRVVATADKKGITPMAYMREAIRKRLDHDDNKLCDDEIEYITVSELKQKMTEILRDPKFKEEVFRD
jgi:predicted DNA-binding protein